MLITLTILYIQCIADRSFASSESLEFDTSVGLGRRFDGVGAISGGGATSKLLVNYPLEQRDAILDFLFKPNFGAALQILKVEIGGDAQSSEGTESSHMHEPWDENYERGYEWWIMTEAKKRNPNIQLCGLSWGYPAWLGDYAWNPFAVPNRTADYIVRWVWGAKKFYDLDIDCIGIWNEKPYSVDYIKALRQTLNSRGFERVKIIAADLLPSGSWSIVNDIMRDPELYKAIDIIGGHYTGSYSSPAAQNCSKPLWSSEDWSDGSSEDGAGCMARLLNQNYLMGFMTSTIAWNLVNSYYNYLPYSDASLMTAHEPWSGYYEVNPPIWGTAHTTQFVDVGWTYLKHGHGVASLAHGGSVVSLISPDSKDFTIIIETMDTTGGKFCLRPPAVPAKVIPQNVTLILKGSLSGIKSLTLWQSSLRSDNTSVLFRNAGLLSVTDGRIELQLDVNSIYTLTTLKTGRKGIPGKIPQPADFPIPYKDDFEGYREYEEPYNFVPEVGVFEVRQSNNVSHGKVMRQVILVPPIHWCPVIQSQPLGVIGNYNWSNVRVTVDVLVPFINASNGVVVAARVDQGGCYTFLAHGVFFFLIAGNNRVIIARDLARTDVIYSCPFTVRYNYWYTMSLMLKGNRVTASVDGTSVYSGDVTSVPAYGFVGLGTDRFGLADFDNLSISAT